MNLITQCCYCKRVKMEVNRWTDHPITLDTSLRNITHGACPECFEAQIKSLDIDLGARQNVVKKEVVV